MLCPTFSLDEWIRTYNVKLINIRLTTFGGFKQSLQLNYNNSLHFN